jgi:hypothetical protein
MGLALVIRIRRPGKSFMAMPKKKKKAKLVPRRGPPTNLRTAGVHTDRKRKTLKGVDERERDDLIALGSWAFEEE